LLLQIRGWRAPYSERRSERSGSYRELRPREPWDTHVTWRMAFPRPAVCVSELKQDHTEPPSGAHGTWIIVLMQARPRGVGGAPTSLLATGQQAGRR